MYIIPVIIGHLIELLHRHGLLLNVDLLVEALLPCHDLADGGWDRQVQFLQVIALFAGTPLLWGYDLQGYNKHEIGGVIMKTKIEQDEYQRETNIEKAEDEKGGR